MRKVLLHIIALVLALFFMLAGSGLNIVKFCCDICSVRGIEEVALNYTNATHNENETCDSCSSCQDHEEESTQDLACTDSNHMTEGCHLLRLKVETPTIIDNIQFKKTNTEFNQFEFILLAFNNAFDFKSAERQISHPPPNNFVLLTSRQILSKKSVLII